MIDPKLPRQNPLVVSICGPSNAGKSQLAKATAAQLGADIASRVPVDYFLVPREPIASLADYHARPMQWDWALLGEQLMLPIGSATSTPDLDFESFRRRVDTDGLPFTIRPVMLCDAIAPFPESDVVVRLDVPDQVRRQRMVERDQRWGTRVAERLLYLDATWNTACASITPDLVLDGTRPLTQKAKELAGYIRRQLVNGEEKHNDT